MSSIQARVWPPMPLMMDTVHASDPGSEESPSCPDDHQMFLLWSTSVLKVVLKPHRHPSNIYALVIKKVKSLEA